MKILVIFGASDQERTAAIALAQSADHFTALATVDGKPVHPGNAYVADGCDTDLGSVPVGTAVVLFECDGPALRAAIVAAGLKVVAKCDHHNEGDAGYGKPADESVDASAISQLSVVLGTTLTQDGRTIGAMDHNLRAAAQGEVPGIDPADVLRLRAPEVAKRMGVSVDEAIAEMARIMSILQSQKPLPNGVVDLRGLGMNAAIGDASAMTGIPAIGFQDARFPCKLNIVGATPEQVTDFLGEWGDKLGLIPGKSDPNTNPEGRFGIPGRGIANGFVTLMGMKCLVLDVAISQAAAQDNAYGRQGVSSGHFFNADGGYTEQILRGIESDEMSLDEFKKLLVFPT